MVLVFVNEGKNLVVEHRAMVNASVQYFFTYFIIFAHKKLAISKQHGGSLQFPFPDTAKALVGYSLAGL